MSPSTSSSIGRSASQRPRSAPHRRFSRFVRENSLSLVLLALFLASLLGQFLTGLAARNEERAMHHLAALTPAGYLGGGEFLAAVFENWESEFLQMAAYVLLTIFLRQKGSPESKRLDGGEEEVDADPAAAVRGAPGAPWPLRAGSPALRWLYANSLGLALGALFAGSFVLHWVHSARHAAEQAAAHGWAAPGLLEHLGSARLWFESFQNWQSEFLATFALVVLGTPRPLVPNTLILSVSDADAISRPTIGPTGGAPLGGLPRRHTSPTATRCTGAVGGSPPLRSPRPVRRVAGWRAALASMEFPGFVECLGLG